MSESNKEELLNRIAEALERLAPPVRFDVPLDSADAFVWHAEGEFLEAVAHINRVDLSLLKGVDQVRDLLHENTKRFANGLPANVACPVRPNHVFARYIAVIRSFTELFPSFSLIHA